MILPPEAHPLLAASSPRTSPARPTSPVRHAPGRRGHPDHRPADRRQPAPHPRPTSPPGTATGYRGSSPAPAGPGSHSAAPSPGSCSTTSSPTARSHLVGDDTVDGHPGRTVYGKARHRDAVRSSHSYTAWRYGHKWVVLAVLVKFPFATRRWALPVLIDLYRTPGGRPGRGPPAPHPGPTHVPAAPPAADPVPRTGPSCSPGIRATGRTRWPGSATATATG